MTEDVSLFEDWLKHYSSRRAPLPEKSAEEVYADELCSRNTPESQKVAAKKAYEAACKNIKPS